MAADKFVLTAQLQLQAPKNVKQIHKQIQSELKGASVNVEVKKGAKAVKDLNSIARSTKKVEQESKSAATQADRMGKAFGSALKNVLRYDLARRVFSAFANTIEQGVQDAIKFEREMIKIAQVSGQTMKQLKGLENTITGLAKSLGVSSAALAKTGLILKQTGLSVQDTQIAMEALAKTELAPTFDNIADTAETAVAAMRQFGIEAKNLEQLLSKINTVAGNFAIEASDIGVAIRRAGGAFKAAGGQVEELIALMTSVRGTTRETAETIATGFRTIFTRLQRPTTIKFLRQFGIELTDLEGKFVGPYEAIRRLSSALEGISPQDIRFSTIVEQLGGFRQVSKVIPLIQQFGTAQKALNAQMEGGDSLARDAATAQQSLAVQIQKVTENVKELFREITQSDAFQAIAKGALAFANAITKIAKAIAPILPIIAALVSAKAAMWGFSKLKFFGGAGLGKSMGSATGDTSDMFRGNRGGRVKRFGSGGWVPGSGSGDTVPAMLEPGEFVLRKSAAQAFGPKLSGINKYQSGGRAKNIAAAQLRYKSTTDGDSLNVDFVPRKRWQNSSSRLLGYDAYEKGSPKAKTKGTLKERTLGNYATKAMDTYIKGKSAKQIKSMFDAGDAFQQDKKRMKFGRLPFRAGKFGASLVRQGLAVKGAGATGGLGSKIQKWAEMELKNPGSATYPRTGPAAGDYKKWVRERANRIRKDRQKAQGTKKKGMAGGGLVPSLLTPGEFVVNKKSAQSFGYGKLRSMNKYAGGGTVQRFNTGGSPMGGGMMGGGGMQMMGMMSMFGGLREGGVQATKGLYSAAEGALFAYAKFQFAASAANAIGTSLGLGGKTLDAFTGTIGNSLAIIVAFNAAMKTAAAMQVFGAIGGQIAGFGKMLSGLGGKVSGFAGKRLGGLGKNIGARQFGLLAKGARQKTRAADVLGRRSASLRRGAIPKVQKMRARASEMRKLRAEAKGLLGPKGGQPRGKGAARDIRRLKEIKGSLNSFKGAQTTAKASLKAAKDSAKGFSNMASKAGRAAKMLKALNVAGFVATYAIGKLGSYIEGQALKQIKESGGKFKPGEEASLVRKAGVGGGIKGAATGAAIGMILGPLGAVVGGLVGGIWGAVTAMANAEREIKAAKFRGSIKDMSDAMDGFSKGQVTASGALSQVITTLNKTRENISGVDAGEGAEGLAAVQKNSQILVKSLAKNSSSVAEFDSKLRGNVQTLLNEGFVRQEQIDILREEVKKREEVQAKLDEYAMAHERVIRQLVQLGNVSAVFDEVSYRLSSFGDVISSISSPSGAAGIGGGFAGLLRPGSGDPDSIKRFELAIDRLGNIGGERGAGLKPFTSQLKDIGFLQRNIETILIRAGAGGKGITQERAQERIGDELKNALESERGAGGALGDRLDKHFESILRSLKPLDLADIEGNIDKLSKAFLDGQQKIIEGYQKAAELLDKHTLSLAQAYDTRRALEYQYIKGQQDLLKQRFDAEAQYAKDVSVGKIAPGRTNEELQQQFQARQRVGLRDAGRMPLPEGLQRMGLKGAPLESFVGDKNVKALGRAFKTITAQLVQNRVDLANAETLLAGGAGEALGKSVANLTQRNDQLTKQYDALKSVLGAYANSQERLVVLNDELARSQARQKTLRDLAIQARFGTAEEKDTAARLINAVVIAQQKGIDAVAPQLQRQVIGLLQQGIIGQQGLDLINRPLKEVGYGEGITSTSAETKRLLTEKSKLQEIGRQAAIALQEELAGRADAMGTVIEDQNKKFLTELATLLKFKEKQEIGKDQAVAQRQMQGSRNAFNVLEDLGIAQMKPEQQQQALENLRTTAERFSVLVKETGPSRYQVTGKTVATLKDLLAGTGKDGLGSFDKLLNRLATTVEGTATQQWRQMIGVSPGNDAVLGEAWWGGGIDASLGDYNELAPEGYQQLFGRGGIAGLEGQGRPGAAKSGIFAQLEKSIGHIFLNKEGESDFYKTAAEFARNAVTQDQSAAQLIGAFLREASAREQAKFTEKQKIKAGGTGQPTIVQIRRYMDLSADERAAVAPDGKPINIEESNKAFQEGIRMLNEANMRWNEVMGDEKGPLVEGMAGYQPPISDELKIDRIAGPDVEKPRDLADDVKPEDIGKIVEATKVASDAQQLAANAMYDASDATREAARVSERISATFQLRQEQELRKGMEGEGKTDIEINDAIMEERRRIAANQQINQMLRELTMTRDPSTGRPVARRDSATAQLGFLKPHEVEGKKPLSRTPEPGKPYAEGRLEVPFGPEYRAIETVTGDRYITDGKTVVKITEKDLEQSRVKGFFRVPRVKISTAEMDALWKAILDPNKVYIAPAQLETDKTVGEKLLGDVQIYDDPIMVMLKKLSWSMGDVRTGPQAEARKEFVTRQAELDELTPSLLRPEYQGPVRSIEPDDLPDASLQDQAAKAGLDGGSLYTHDIHSEKILNEMLAVMKGNPGRPDAVARVHGANGANGDRATGQNGADIVGYDTTALDISIQKFSQSVTDLSTVIGGDMTLEVTGKIDVDVKLNGAEFLTGASDSIGKYVAFKVTNGINNFIKQGLKDSSIRTRSNWDENQSLTDFTSGIG